MKVLINIPDDVVEYATRAYFTETLEDSNKEKVKEAIEQVVKDTLEYAKFVEVKSNVIERYSKINFDDDIITKVAIIAIHELFVEFLKEEKEKAMAQANKTKKVRRSKSKDGLDANAASFEDISNQDDHEGN